MPELSEIARIVHFLREHLVGKTVSKVHAQHDESVFGKAGTSAAEFQKAMTGKKIVGAGQQGKYFWMTMSSSPHPVMHFGMAGWLKLKGIDTHYSQSDDGQWPPKYWKFMLETEGAPKIEAAFVDFRRFSRVKLVDCPGNDIRKHSPLKENGPDPVIDKAVLTEEWLAKKLRSKKVPVKALLLDQANISGIGNWIGDEVLYHAKIHPEQYSNSLSDQQINELWSSIHYVCSTSVDLLGDADKFPTDWLFKYRWNKGKKDAPQHLPNGERVSFITVGGRTSAVVPSIQKKTGPITKDVGSEKLEAGSNHGPKKGNTAGKRKRAAAKKEESESEAEEDEVPSKKSAPKKRGPNPKQDETAEEKTERKGGSKNPQVVGKTNKNSGGDPPKDGPVGRRRSARIAR